MEMNKRASAIVAVYMFLMLSRQLQQVIAMSEYMQATPSAVGMLPILHRSPMQAHSVWCCWRQPSKRRPI
jgi:hypothetical protein